jgi:hypothetical protein
MNDQEKTGEASEQSEVKEYIDESVELFSPEFYDRLSIDNDRETWQLLHTVGLVIKDKGMHKYLRAIFRNAIQDTLRAWHERILTRAEMHEYIRDLGTGKLTRYKLESVLQRRRREAGKN